MTSDNHTREYCYKKICETVIMKYRDQDQIDPDDVTVDDEEVTD